MVGPHPISPGASHFSLMPQNDEECTRLAGCRSHVYSDGRDAHETSRLNHCSQSSLSIGQWDSSRRHCTPIQTNPRYSLAIREFSPVNIDNLWPGGCH